MVKGLDLFRAHFKDHNDTYVLIGGAACDTLFDQAGVPFRATKDLDIVLCVEALDDEFGKAFWEFIKAGGYQVQETSEGQKRFYRFKKPADPAYPVMLELFSKQPDMLPKLDGTFTPIPFDDDISSLSAILLDEEWYGWIKAGTTLVGDLPVVDVAHLIALKAKAWNALKAIAASGVRVDSGDIKKHRNDVFRLFAILDPEARPTATGAVAAELNAFLAEVIRDPPPNLKDLGIDNTTLVEACDRLRTIFGLT